MDLLCQDDRRRAAVRAAPGRNGVDYVEVATDEPRLDVTFLGKLPPQLAAGGLAAAALLRIEGGSRVTGLRITAVEPHVDPDPERDDRLVVTLDRRGDLSTYQLRLVGVAGIDPRYDRATFSFAIDCPSDLDCGPTAACPPETPDEPHLSYLAKDYGSFRQLIFDRLALLVPGWTERHVPDIGVTLVELLAYVGDLLSYYQDAVATEAYLQTARQRISVRRHARLVDYRLHEGCNARAWVVLSTSADVDLPARSIAFATRLVGMAAAQPATITAADLDHAPPGTSCEVFEPMVSAQTPALQLRAAHNEIRFYTWGQASCCLTRGATRAFLLDGWVGAAPPGSPAGRPPRALALRPGDVLIFEEVLGARTGVAADADPRRRHAVRLTAVAPLEDPIYPSPAGAGTLPTPVLEIRWAAEDALPFALCLSAIGAAPACAGLTDVSVARGNVVLVDHGRTGGPEALGGSPVVGGAGCCVCEGEAADVPVTGGPFRPTLARGPLTFRDPRPVAALPAARALGQDLRAALPAVSLADETGAAWSPALDLLAGGPDDRLFVAEIDNLGLAHLRFGDDELGRAPAAGGSFQATYRVGLGVRGNVGAETITRLVFQNAAPNGVAIMVRNPMPAAGGTDPEPIEEAKLFAPRAFRKTLERAVTADDYAQLAEEDPALQRAAAALVWTGSWYEAEVAVDPLEGTLAPEPGLLEAVAHRLSRYRRMGHDLRVEAARDVPIKVTLQVCVLPGYDRGDVQAALLARFCRRPGTAGTTAFFDPDNLTFGEGVYVSRLVAAAQSVTGVECATVTELRRLFDPANHELETGVLPLGAREIAQLDNDPSFPEHGQLVLVLRGGR